MPFEYHQTVWVPLPCGTRLAAAIWMPEGPGPHPAVLEYLPYRRRDQTAWRDWSTYPAYAKAGIVGVRVDARGQGDSDGLFDDEYSPQELSDICAVIAWICAQDWSSGKVGMMGISWGGFNALQVAALAPPGLAGVISIASTVDRYADDIHFKGGAMLSANVSWAGTMLSFLSRPPDPEIVGNRWAEIWSDRLAQQPILLDTWLAHQRRDAYWRHGSICEDWGAIQCPVWAIAGWADGYRNTPAAVLAGLTGPGMVKATTGPWIHKYPHFAWPKPRMDFIGRSVDWWLHCLADQDRGVPDWPDHTVFCAEAVRPRPRRDADQGRWLGVARGYRPVTRTFALGDDGTLGAEAARPTTIATPQHCGTMAGEYFTGAPDADLPADQRLDDALSVCWQTDPLAEDVVLFGRATVQATLAIDRPQGTVTARLMDVHPDGTAALIARGVLNLSHRSSHAEPEPMVPGAAAATTITLDEACYRLRPGHRLRLALSTAYWPLLVPSPEPVIATLMPGAHLAIPLAPEDAEIALPQPPDGSVPEPFINASPPLAERSVAHDLQAGKVQYRLLTDTGLVEIEPSGLTARDARREVWTIAPDNPDGATGHLHLTAERRRGAWATRTEAEITFRAAAATFEVQASLTAYNGDDRVTERSWAFSIPRDHV